MTRVVVIGYYGFGNLGDEAVLCAIRAHLRERIPNISLCVLSADPEQTRAMHGVDAVYRGDFRDVARACRDAHWICSGGGSLFQDATSWRSPLYYGWLHELAFRSRPRMLVYAQGVGPLRRPASRWVARRVFRSASHITVRDPVSMAVVRALGVRSPIEVVCDPALGLDALQDGAYGSVATVGVSVRTWPGEWFRPFADVIKRLAADRGTRIRIVSFHAAQDWDPSRRLADHLGEAEVVAPRTPQEALSAMTGLGLFVGMRLHALVLAAVAGVPVVGLAYDPKVRAIETWLSGARVRDLPLDGRMIDFASDWDDRVARAASVRAEMPALRQLARRPAEIAAAWGAA